MGVEGLDVDAGARAGRFAFARAGSPVYAIRWPSGPHPMIKSILKTVAFLALLFVMLYVGMNNPQSIDFHFPVAGTTAKAPLRASAALIYFGIFAVGVLGGTILATGSGGKRASAAGKTK
jgi:uncharacterized membrane protein YciS (DUF1049 family)